MVMVYRTFNIAEAQVVASRLEVAGMHPQVLNDIASVSIDGYTQATGGVQVEVPDEEADDARQLILDSEKPTA
jgi:hypothetical protein